MTRRAIILLLTLALLTPALVASHALAKKAGDGDDCEEDRHGKHHGKRGNGHYKGSDGDDENCRREIPDTIIGPGENVTYTGNWLATGELTVLAGGSAHFVDADVVFESTSAGFTAEPGGKLHIVSAALIQANGSTFTLDAADGSDFKLESVTIIGGNGIRVATNQASISGNAIENMSLALQLTGVSATIHNNTFRNNTVAVNLTGGAPTLADNHIEATDVCIRDWQTDPTIVRNTLRNCAIGIYHEQSASIINNNDLADHAVPPGVGLWIIGVLGGGNDGARVSGADTTTTIVEGNLISQFGTGIKLSGAGDIVLRNNIVEDSHNHGILVESVTGAITLEGNTVRHNGGDGIRILDAPSATLTNNAADHNTGNGMTIAISDVTIDGGSASHNGAHGLILDHALGVHVEDMTTNGNTQDGVHMLGSRATIHRVNASQNGANGFRYDPMGPIELLGPTALDGVRALSNGRSGLLNIDGNATSAHNSWWQGNANAGVENLDLTSVIDARDNYWGSATGPTTPLNPLGTGDRVIGPVLFAPFRTTPPA